MISWILENIASIIIAAILIAAVAGIIINMVRNKKKGKSSCGCGCSNCAMSAHCRGREKSGK